jgi:hypothetical protein
MPADCALLGMGPVSRVPAVLLMSLSGLRGYEDGWIASPRSRCCKKGCGANGSQDAPAAKGQSVAVDDGILGGLKDSLFGSTGRAAASACWCCS